MTTHNPKNERIKRQYFTYLKAAQCYSEDTVDAVAKALDRFETYTGYRDFKNFRWQQAFAFTERLVEGVSPASGKKLSKATLYSTMRYLRSFFH